MKNCKHYPSDNEVKNDPNFAPVCGCGSDISGHECNEEDEKKCPWAKEKK